MTTLRCRACLRRWRAGGPYACDGAPDAAASEGPARGEVELAPVGCLGAVLLIGGWALWWLLELAWHAVRELLGWW